MISIARHGSGVAPPAAERGWEPRGTQAEIERDPQTGAVDLMTGVQPAWMPK